MRVLPRYPRGEPDTPRGYVDTEDAEGNGKEHIADSEEHKSEVSTDIHAGVGRCELGELNATIPENAKSEG